MSNESSIFKSLGEFLLTKDGSLQPTQSVLSNKKYIGLYFSAHWCPPCRGFTPQLAEFYNRLKADNPENFEIVFISSDRTDSDFNAYYSEMPWVALPYAERELKAKLSQANNVQGIPMLVIIDASDSSIITNKGRNKVSSDPEGASFPWKPLSIKEEIGHSFVNAAGESFDSTSFQGKFVGLYFSASWCGPCQDFTPKLAAFYNKRKSDGNNDFEVIFCTSDRSSQSFSDYLGIEIKLK
jgi:nucleoredoxin